MREERAAILSWRITAQLLDDDLFDERILGGGDFVEQVLRGEESSAVPETTLAELIARVADYSRLPADEVSWPCRCPQTVQAKAIICYFGMRRMKLPATVIAAALGNSPSAVSKATLWGEGLYRDDEGLQLLLG